MHIVAAQFLREVLDREIHDEVFRRRAHEGRDKILNLDLSLVGETYFGGSLRELRALNHDLAAVNEALQRANRAKTEFLATVSHELRTPLTSIIGFSRLLAEENVLDRDTQRDFARDIHASSLALLSLVDEILDVARIEAGKMDIGLEQVDVGKLVEEVMGTIKVDAERKGLTLIVEVPADLPAARADRSRLRQVLVNILGNGVKFTETGGVWLAARAGEDAGRIMLIVRDTGIGIAAEHQQGLYERFRQVDASDGQHRGGLGLGLAISKALVDRMEGSIELRSEGPNTGTTVTITIPIHEASRARRPLLDGLRQSGRPCVAEHPAWLVTRLEETGSEL